MTNNESNITCIDFGINRVNEFQKTFFCAQCKNWENLGPSKGRCKRDSRRFKCTAVHQSLDLPDEKKVKWCRMIDVDQSDASEIDINGHEEENKPKYSSRMKGHMSIEKLNERIKFLENKIHRQTKIISYYTKKCEALISDFKASSFDTETTLKIAMERAFTQCGTRSNNCRVKIITNVVWSSEFMNGMVRDKLRSLAREEIKKIFSARNILKKMDTSSGSLNLSGLELLREVENDNSIKYYRGILPSRKMIYHIQKQLHDVGDTVNPFEPQHASSGEAILFDEKKMLPLLFKTYGIHDEAKSKSVELALTCDGTDVTNNLSQMIRGFKMIHHTGINPLNGKTISPQTRNVCWPTQIVMGRENKLMCSEQIVPKLEYFRSAEVQHSDGNSLLFPQYKPIQLSLPTDKSATWKIINKGGAAKVKIFFCHCCDTTSEKIHHPNNAKCSTCVSYNNNWNCYHKSMITENYTDNLKDKVNALLHQLSDDLENVRKESKLKIISDDSQEAASDPLSVDHVPQNTIEAIEFMELLTDESLLRDVDTMDKGLDELRDALKQHLTNEIKLTSLVDRLRHCTRDESIKYLLLQLVPCILHLETRVGLKLFTILLEDGLSEYMYGTHAQVNNINSEKERIKLFVNLIETEINTKILGDSRLPYQFKIPMEKNKSTSKSQIGTISLENTKVRSITEKLTSLIKICLSSDEKQSKWMNMINDYNEAMNILRKKGMKYTDDELKKFQFKIDSFANTAIPLYGKRMLTNYMHDLVSGHVQEFMKEWGCLFRYSQQGWEALNSLVKTIFFRRTNRGGTANTTRSKLIPVARVFQRRLLWLSGLADDVLDGKNIDYVINDIVTERQASVEEDNLNTMQVTQGCSV